MITVTHQIDHINKKTEIIKKESSGNPAIEKYNY